MYGNDVMMVCTDGGLTFVVASNVVTIFTMKIIVSNLVSRPAANGTWATVDVLASITGLLYLRQKSVAVQIACHITT